MQKKFRLFTPVICLLMALSAVLVLLALPVSRVLFYAGGALTLLIYAVSLVLLRRANRLSGNIMKQIGEGVVADGEEKFTESPLPLLVVYDNSEIIWCNALCQEKVFGGRDLRGEHIGELLPEVDVSDTSPPEGYEVTLGGRSYTVFVTSIIRGTERLAMVQMVDDTDLKHCAREYQLSKPCVALIIVDNYEEMTQDYSDVERAQLMSQIESVIEQYIYGHNGFITRIQRDRFIAIIEERGIEKIVSNKFDLLDQVRNIRAGDRMNATLSIGVGRDAPSMAEGEAMANQALDMCLGRGGDQVAVKNQTGYEFFGGLSKGIEKRTKVKTRIIANALSELIETSGNVIIMGHRFADLDCLGASIGMLKSVRATGTQAVICIHPEKNLVHPLLDKLMAGGYPPEDFVRPEDALNMVNHRTLLIVLDTHVPNVLESEELYRSCRNVVVIDHHRKLVNYIDNAVIFYHEPYASSTAEMVTELTQYFPKPPQLTKLEAEALLSGIMLDTKNFILRTGVRTFEAAAYLRKLGADTVEVRKLSASSIDAYQKRAGLAASAEIYQHCAIAATDEAIEDIKIIAPQTADELMTVSGVDAAFVIYDYEGVVSVSARSMGTVNVQVIMEKLGGGGHHTMAAAQFPGEKIGPIRDRVKEAISNYYASLTETQH